MKNVLAILAATAAVGLASSGYAAQDTAEAKSKVEYKKDGGYESTRSSEHVAADGTKHSTETKVDVDVDSKGKVDKTVKTESVTDPKGLMNKKKDVVKSTVEEKDRGGFEQTTTRKHTDAEGTNVTTKTDKEVEVDSDGNVVETTKTENKVDPKGLMNKTTTTNKSKVVNGRVIEQTKKVDQ